MTTVVKYFVLETDEYAEPKHPNIFRTMKPSDQLLLKDIKDRFSDWKGGFNFYFKTLIDSGNSPEDYVWENIADDNQVVPQYKGEIIVKAVRTGFKQFFEIKSREKEIVPSANPVSPVPMKSNPQAIVGRRRSITATVGVSPPSVASTPRGPGTPRGSEQFYVTTDGIEKPKIEYTMDEEAMFESLEKTTHFAVAELRAMYSKFKKETPSLEIEKDGFVKVTKGLGIADEFLQDLIFNKFDKDKNGTVDFVEFASGLSVISRGTPEEKLKSAFDMYDIDGDGHITKEEFSKIVASCIKYRGGSITTMGRVFTDVNDLCEAVFAALDNDQDGEITFTDFQQGAIKNPEIIKGLNII